MSDTCTSNMRGECAWI